MQTLLFTVGAVSAAAGAMGVGYAMSSGGKWTALLGFLAFLAGVILMTSTTL